MVIQEERVKTISREMEDRPDVMAMAVQSRGRGESKEKGGFVPIANNPDMVLIIVLLLLGILNGGEIDPEEL